MMSSAAEQSPTSSLSAPIAPIPVRFADDREQREWVRQIFNDTAADYDRLESWVSLGTGRWYRRHVLRQAGLAPGMSVVDVATGTGLVAREAMRIVGSQGRVVGIDPSEQMLGAARAALGIETRVAWADALALGDAAFDFVTMGYALRHMNDLNAVFREFARVLKPRGRVCILEVTKPSTRLGASMLRAYMGGMSGAACAAMNVSARSRELWRYYWTTIDQCIPPVRVLAALESAGFERATRSVSLGVFSEYTATRAGS